MPKVAKKFQKYKKLLRKLQVLQLFLAQISRYFHAYLIKSFNILK